MQYLRLKINNSFTGDTSTQELDSDLILSNGYFSHTTNNNKTIVNENNVRNFLDAENNEKLAENFIQYIQQNTTAAEFKEIFYDDKKLASVFNTFYDNNPEILLNNENSKTVKADIKKNSSLINESNENYYICVKIDWTKKLIEDIDFSEYTKDCVSKNYTYKKKYIEKAFKTTTSIVNYDFVKQSKGKNNIGYVPIEENIVVIPDKIYLDIQKNGSYTFESLSQFEYFFNIGPNPLMGSISGLGMSSQVIPVSNHRPTLNYNFLQQSLIQINGQTTLGNKIIFNTGVSQGSLGDKNVFYYIQFEPYSNVIFGTDFILDVNNPTSQTIDINIPYISSSFTLPFNSIINSSIKPDSKIVLSLRSKRDSNEVVSFLFLKIEEFFELKFYENVNSLKEKDIIMPKVFLNCYVDYNFNDNESEFFENPVNLFNK